MNRRLLASVFILAVPGFSPCLAQTTTNAAAQVQQLLKTFGKVPVQHDVMISAFVRLPIFVPEILTAGNISVVASTPPKFGTPIITSLPRTPGGASWIWVNCSTTVVPTYSGQVVITEQRSASASISNGVTNTNSQQINFAYKAESADYGGFDIGGVLGTSQAGTTTTVDQNTYSSQYGFQGTVTVNNLQSNHAVLAVTTVDQFNVAIPFSATITVDADLSANQKNYKRLSDIVPDPTKRTFSIDGQIAEVDWANVLSSTQDIPFSQQYCQSGAGVLRLETAQ